MPMQLSKLNQPKLISISTIILLHHDKDRTRTKVLKRSESKRNDNPLHNINMVLREIYVFIMLVFIDLFSKINSCALRILLKMPKVTFEVILHLLNCIFTMLAFTCSSNKKQIWTIKLSTKFEFYKIKRPYVTFEVIISVFIILALYKFFVRLDFCLRIHQRNDRGHTSFNEKFASSYW